MSPAGALPPRPQWPGETDAEYQAYIARYRARLLAANPWLTDTKPLSYLRHVLRQLFGRS